MPTPPQLEFTGSDSMTESSCGVFFFPCNVCIYIYSDKKLSFCSSYLFQGSPVEILPFLYLGSAYHASKCEFLTGLRITALLNVSRKSTGYNKDQYDYKWIPVEDNHTTDISSHFQEAIDFIGEWNCSGVVINCKFYFITTFSAWTFLILLGMTISQPM